MKNIVLIIVILVVGTMESYTQSTTTGHTPGGTRHLGWDDTNDTQLRITQNNTNRMLFNSLPTWNGINGVTATDASRLTFGLNGQSMVGWSMLHFMLIRLFPQKNIKT